MLELNFHKTFPDITVTLLTATLYMFPLFYMDWNFYILTMVKSFDDIANQVQR